MAIAGLGVPVVGRPLTLNTRLPVSVPPKLLSAVTVALRVTVSLNSVGLGVAVGLVMLTGMGPTLTVSVAVALDPPSSMIVVLSVYVPTVVQVWLGAVTVNPVVPFPETVPVPGMLPSPQSMVAVKSAVVAPW